MIEDLRYLESLIVDKKYTSHPTDEQLADFIDNRLLGNIKDEVMDHLAHCDECREVINEVIEYKKKSKLDRLMVALPPLVAMVASLLVFVYLPQNVVEIGMIDLSKITVEYRTAGGPKSNEIIDGDTLLQEVIDSTDVTYLESFIKAEDLKEFGQAIDLYQEAINRIDEDENIGEKERLEQIIVIHTAILQRAIKEDNQRAMDNYREWLINYLSEYYLNYKGERR